MKKFIKQANLPSAAYDEVIMDKAFGYYAQKTKQQKRWCAMHPTGKVGKNYQGVYFMQCNIGYKRGETCDIRIA